jgi:lipoate-protein ligase A
MAIDQTILAMHAKGESPPTLRIYQWRPSAISLGYFQRCHRIDLAACRQLGIDVVRRPTGGRAVLHFEDLSYAVVAGTADGIPSYVATTYRLICEGLLAAFRALGFAAELGHQDGKSPKSEMCFLTSTAGDIRHNGGKFVGSAQTWHGSSVLQHGSIVLEPHFQVLVSLQRSEPVTSKSNEQLPRHEMTSVREILGHVPSVNEIGAAIRHGMAQVLGMEFAEDELSPKEWALARTITNQHVEEELCPAQELPRCQSVG